MKVIEMGKLRTMRSKIADAELRFCQGALQDELKRNTEMMKKLDNIWMSGVLVGFAIGMFFGAIYGFIFL